MLAFSPLDISDSGEKIFNLSADYAERKNLEMKIDNKNFIAGIFRKIAQRFQRGFEKIFFRREVSQGDCRGRRHFCCGGQAPIVFGPKGFQKSGGRDGQNAFNDLIYINMDILLKKNNEKGLPCLVRSLHLCQDGGFWRDINCGQFAYIFCSCFYNTVNASSGFLLSAKYLTSSFAAADMVSKSLFVVMLMAVFMMGKDLFKFKREDALFIRN